jgi:general secretion pathway protein A
MGKTCLVRELATTLDRHRYTVVYLSSARLSGLGLVCVLAQKLHLSPRRTHLETVQLLAEALLAQNTHVLLWIDEADHVPQALLQEVRMLAEPDVSSEQLVSVVLSGLPALLACLDTPALFPLKRRIGCRVSLAGLRRDELDDFLVHRFGPQHERLLQTVRDELFERTAAVPALLDSVVRRALERSGESIDQEALRVVLDAAGL